MNPFKYAQMMKYLTRAKKQKPDLPDVFPASQAPIPKVKDSVATKDAINRFVRDNPRTEKADGGMLVQPGFGGVRQGYKDDKAASLANDYKKIVNYALNNRKIKNFNEPVEVIVKGKKTKINYVPTVVEWAKMNGVDRSIFQTKEGNIIPIKREQVYKKIVDDTIKLNNQTFTFSVPADIAMDIGITKNQGRSSGVEDLLKKGNVTKLLSKEELLSNYIKYLIDNDAPLKDLTNESIFKHINSRRVDKIKLTPDRNKQTTFADSKRTIGFNNISKTMKEQYPDLFAKIGRGGEIPFLSRTIQNKSNLGNLRLSEAFQKTESGNIYFNLIKSQNLNVRKQIAGLVSETDILQGKLKLDQKSLAISNAQDKMIKDLNKYVLNKPEVILNNPSFRQLASMRFENGKFIVDDNPEVIDKRLQRYINNGFFSTDHKVSKRTGKLNIEFPTNKQIVPTFINGPIKSMEDYITNNISKYSSDANIKTNIDNIVKVATNNNFTVNVPKGYSNIFGTNRTNIGAVGDIATVSADGSVLKSYDDQLKRFNLNIDNIPELSNTKVVDYAPVDKSKIAQTLETKTKTLQSLKVSNLDQPQLKKVLPNLLNAFCESGRIKQASGTNPDGLTCSMEEIQRGIQKETDKAKKVSKDGRIPKKFGKLRALGSALFGTADPAIEFMFAAPYLVAGDIEGAKNQTIFGLYGFGGERNLDKMSNKEAQRYLKHERATRDWMTNYFTAEEKKQELKNLQPNTGAFDLATKQLNKANENMANIADDYGTFGYSFVGADTPLQGKVAMQKQIRGEVAQDFEKKIEKAGSTEFFKDSDPNMLDLNLRQLGGDPKEVTPITDLESYMANKGEPMAGNENLFFNVKPYVLNRAMQYGVGDIFDDYAAGAGVEAPGRKSLQDAYSEIPLEYASQLAALEKKQLEEGLLKKQLDLGTGFAGGGIAKIAGVDSGPPPESGPNSQGLQGLLKRVRNR